MVKSYSRIILQKLYRMAFSYEQAKAIVLQNLNEELSLETINLLLKDPDSGIRVALGKYKYTPADVIIGLSQDKLSKVRASAALSELLPEEYVDKLSQDPSDAVRISVAKRKKMSQSVADRLSSDESEDVKLAMSERQGLSPDNAKNLLDGLVYNKNIIKNVYKNTTISKDNLKELISHPDESIRASIAKRRDLTPEFIQVLSKDKSDLVKEALAGNNTVQAETISQIYQDNLKKVKITAALSRNKNTSPELIKSLASDPRQIIKLNIIYNPSVTEEALNILLSNSMKDESIKELLSSRKNIPGSILRRLSGETNEKILENVARAMNLPEDVFLVLLDSSPKIKKILSGRTDVPASVSSYLTIYKDILEGNLTNLSSIDDKFLSALSQEKDPQLIQKLIKSGNKKIIYYVASGGNQDNKLMLASDKNLAEDIVIKLSETGNAAVHLKLTLQKIIPPEAQKNISKSDSASVKTQLLDRSDLVIDVIRLLAKDPSVSKKALMKLPIKERAQSVNTPSKLMPIEDFEARIKKDQVIFRRLEKIMEINNLQTLNKNDIRKYDPKISQHPIVDKLFASFQGKPISLEQLNSYAQNHLDKQEVALRHVLTGIYPYPDQQSEGSLKGIGRESFTVTLEDGLPDEIKYFIEKWVHQMIGHGIGLEKFNLGHILYKDATKIFNRPVIVIEQVQSDHRYVLAWLKSGSPYLNPEYEADMDKKFGAGSRDRLTKFFTNIRSIYPETLLLEFLRRMRGKEIYMTGPERAHQLTKVDPKAADEVYGKIPSRLGFEPSSDMPGYLRLERANYKKKILIASKEKLV